MFLCVTKQDTFFSFFLHYSEQEEKCDNINNLMLIKIKTENINYFNSKKYICGMNKPEIYVTI